MKLASVRLIAADIKAMVTFYEMVTGQAAEWLAPQFAEIVTPAATLAIGSAETVAVFSEGSAEPGANRTPILEFMVDDVDTLFARLKDRAELVHEPKLLPWGNRSVQFRDPEVFIVSLSRSLAPPGDEHNDGLAPVQGAVYSRPTVNTSAIPWPSHIVCRP